MNRITTQLYKFYRFVAVRFCKLAAALLVLVRSAWEWFESGMTDSDGVLDARAVWGNVCMSVSVLLALRVPSFVASGSTFDLVAYGAVVSIVGGFGITLFGVAGSALRPTGVQQSGVLDRIKDAWDAISAKWGA